MITSASATVTNTSICEPQSNKIHSELITELTIKDELLDIGELQSASIKTESSNGELSFDSQISSGDDSASDRKFRRKNSRPQKVTMLASPEQHHLGHSQLDHSVQHVQQQQSHQFGDPQQQAHLSSATLLSNADPFASLVIDAPDSSSAVPTSTAVSAVGTANMVVSRIDNASYGICETCGSPLASIRNNRRTGQASMPGSDGTCEYVILCVDCTCDKINLLLEENSSCERAAKRSDAAESAGTADNVPGASGDADASSASPRVYACRLCRPAMLFATSRDYLEHYICEHEQEFDQQQVANVTPKLEATIPADEELDNEAAAAAAAEAFRCSHCGLGFRSEDDVEQHERFHLECEFDTNRLRCYYCCKEFAELDALNAHQRAHSTERPHQCTVCDRSFSFACTLQRHMLVHQAFHSTYTCHYCEQTFSDAGQLDRHFDVCERNMDDAAGLASSDASKPGAPNRFLPYSHTCSTCGKSFRLAWRYKLHMRAACNTADKYNADSDRTCSICKKMFANPMNLHRHELIHAGIRNYQCKLCGKAFVQKTQLETHMNIHNGIKPFQCEVCSKTFTDRSTFHKHKKIHVKPKSFPCTVCGKMFNQAGYLKLHAKVHGSNDANGTIAVAQQQALAPMPPNYAIAATNAAAAAAAAAAVSAGQSGSGLTYCNLDQI